MGNINKKEQRRNSLKKQNRRTVERRNIKKMLQEMRDELNAPAVQMEIPFTYDHSNKSKR